MARGEPSKYVTASLVPIPVSGPMPEFEKKRMRALLVGAAVPLLILILLGLALGLHGDLAARPGMSWRDLIPDRMVSAVPVLLVCLEESVRIVRRRGRAKRAQALLDEGAVGRRVRIAPAWSERQMLGVAYVRLRFNVFDEGGGPPLGSIKLAFAPNTFDPRQPFDLVGDAVDGGTVALRRVGTDEVILPGSTFRPAEEGTIGSALDDAARAMLGWSDDDHPGQRDVQLLRANRRAVLRIGRLHTYGIAFPLVFLPVAAFAMGDGVGPTLLASLAWILLVVNIHSVGYGWARSDMVTVLAARLHLQEHEAWVLARALQSGGYGAKVAILRSLA